MKRKSRIKGLIITIVVILCLGGIAAYLYFGLGLFAKKAAVTQAVKTYTVATGNLTTTISAAGNLALAETHDVTASIAYPAGAKGTVGSVLVEVGDTVTKGQVLATRDSNAWNTQIETLKDDITAKERALPQARLNVKNAEQAVYSANETITNKQNAIKTSELNLSNAEKNLSDSVVNAVTTVDFTALVTALNAARAKYEYVTVTWPIIGILDVVEWELAVDQVTEALDIAQKNYDNAIAGISSPEIDTLKKQVEIARDSLAASKQAVIDARADVPLKEFSLSISQASLEDAETALQDAKNTLDEAQKVGGDIISPADGFITSLTINPGDQVLNGTVVMEITNPNKFMVEMSISEKDIADIEVGGTAFVTVDTLSVTLPAKVTYIAPTATIQSGVVNYTVRVELADLTAMPTGGGANFPSSGGGNVPSFGSSNTTAPTFSGNTTLPGGSGRFSGQIPSTQLKKIKLRQGLTVTTNLITAQATNVLLVPYAAVTTVGFQKTVEVIKDDGSTENRTVTTGITDYTNIVITQGLTAGEKVKVNSAAAGATNTNQFQGGGFPVIGGFPRG